MIFPSFVFFLSSSSLAAVAAGVSWNMPVGREEWDVLAGVFRRPRGSFRWARRRTEPMWEVKKGKQSKTRKGEKEKRVKCMSLSCDLSSM